MLRTKAQTEITREIEEGRWGVGERDVEGDRQTDAKVVAEVEAAKWKWKRSQIQAPPAAAM